MNPDIRIEISFKGHRKRRKLKTLLGPDATDYLIDLWIGCALSRPEGILFGYDSVDIAMEAGWGGDPEELVNALVAVGFLDILESGEYALHDWLQHQPFVAKTKEREEHARKAGNARWNKGKSRNENDHAEPGGCPPNARGIRGAGKELSRSLPESFRKNAQSMQGECSMHSRQMPGASSEHAHSMCGASAENGSSMPAASKENAQRMLKVCPEHAPGIPGESNVNAQPMPEECSEHARCNAPIPIPIPPPIPIPTPSLSNLEINNSRESTLSASPGEESPETAPDFSTSSAPGGAVCAVIDSSEPHASDNAGNDHDTPGTGGSGLTFTGDRERDSRREPNQNSLSGNQVGTENPGEPAGESPVAAQGIKAKPGNYVTKRKRKLSGWKLEAFDEFWKSFDYKKGRAEAADAWLDINNPTQDLVAVIIGAARKEAMARPALLAWGKTPKMASGWITGRRWEDWEENGSDTNNRAVSPGREVGDGKKGSLSREEKRARRLEAIRRATERFL